MAESLKSGAVSADNMSMGDVVGFPNCREITPEVSRLIVTRTQKAAYWVRRWSKLNRSLTEVDPKDINEHALEEASLYLLGWLHERNQAALKARGF